MERDALDLRQTLRLFLHDLQRVAAEFLHDSPGECLSDALHGTGSKIALDLLRALGRDDPEGIDRELFAVGRMDAVLALHGKVFPDRDFGQRPCARHRSVLCFNLEHSVKIDVIPIDDIRDVPFEFLHAYAPNVRTAAVLRAFRRTE